MVIMMNKLHSYTHALLLQKCFKAAGIPLESLSKVILSAIAFSSSFAFPIAIAQPTQTLIDHLNYHQNKLLQITFNFSHNALIALPFKHPLP